MRKKLIVGIGEYLFDMLPGGRKAGGAPVNFAYHAAKQGADSCAISALGDDELGRELRSIAAESGINVIAPLVKWPTSTVQVSLDAEGTPTFTICEDVAWDHIPLTPQMLEIAARADVVCFGSLSQRCEESRLTIRRFIEAVKTDALKIYDINLRQHYYSAELIKNNLKLANALKLNDEEFTIICRLLALPGDDEEATCRRLLDDYSLRYVSLTAGADRSTIYCNDGQVSVIATPKVDVVDSVGAGDAFTGAFAASIISGKTLRESHENAVETAAVVCTKPGAWV